MGRARRIRQRAEHVEDRAHAAARAAPGRPLASPDDTAARRETRNRRVRGARRELLRRGVDRARPALRARRRCRSGSRRRGCRAWQRARRSRRRRTPTAVEMLIVPRAVAARTARCRRRAAARARRARLRSRIARAAPTISSDVSPLAASAARNAAGLHRRQIVSSMIAPIASAICSALRSLAGDQRAAAAAGTSLTLRCSSRKFANEPCAVGRQDRLGMELHAVDRQLAMRDALNDAVFARRVDAQFRRKRRMRRRTASGSGSRRTATGARQRRRCRRA